MHGPFFVCANGILKNMPLFCKLEVGWTRGKYSYKVTTNIRSKFLRDEVVTLQWISSCYIHGDNLFVSLRLRARG